MEGTRSDVILIMDGSNEPNTKDHITRKEKPQNPTKLLRRLSFSKPKSRFVEYNNYSNSEFIVENLIRKKMKVKMTTRTTHRVVVKVIMEK
ncbi:hypothetical protein JCGZ_10809 [Jatropha curcas]|uniref:Uncharacterized protein n=1 Tax=Jatropha curcas TaxID=180498 RepID=A0A067KGR4_JATCU|nr:hypothetical protein JCGZ_10809 [Jatropha curcas]